MNMEELKEGAEHAEHSGQKALGLTMAIVAVLLAMATLLGHRTHTEEVVLQGDRNTQWVNYDVKRMQSKMYDAFATENARLPGREEVAAGFKEQAKLEREGEPAKGNAPAKDGTEKIREKAQELDAEMKVTQKRADFYDMSELFLEISIVLCSISLLANSKLYWKLSFFITAIGVALTLYAAFGVH